MKIDPKIFKIIAFLKGGVPLTQASQQIGMKPVTVRKRLKRMGVEVKKIKAASPSRPVNEKAFVESIYSMVMDTATPFEVYRNHGITTRRLINHI